MQLLAAPARQIPAPGFDPVLVFLLHEPRLGADLLLRFQVDEPRLVPVVEAALEVVEHVEDDDFVLPVPEVLRGRAAPRPGRRRGRRSGCTGRGGAAARPCACRVVAHLGPIRRLRLFQRQQHLVQVSAHRSRRHQYSRIASSNSTSPAASCCLIIKNARAAASRLPQRNLEMPLARETHRGALVEQDHALEIGFLLEHLDVVAIGLAVRPSSPRSAVRHRECTGGIRRTRR